MTWLVLSDSGNVNILPASQEADNRDSDSAAAAPSVTGASHSQLILLAVINQDSK